MKKHKQNKTTLLMKIDGLEEESYLFKYFNRRKDEYTYDQPQILKKILKPTFKWLFSSPKKHMEGKFKHTKDF